MLNAHYCIPEEEIWLKIGGDKGGGSFIMLFQVSITYKAQLIYKKDFSIFSILAMYLISML